MTAYSFQVRGTPITQGSKKGFYNKHTQRVVLTESGGQRHKDWRSRLAGAAQDACGDAPMLEGPIVVRLDFRVQKPASAPKRRRTWPTAARSGDADKLARCCLDAFTGVLFKDDAQVTRLVVHKDYGDPGVDCYVAEAVDDEAEQHPLLVADVDVDGRLVAVQEVIDDAKQRLARSPWPRVIDGHPAVDAGEI